MAEQLVFALVEPQAPSFANFVAGPNALCVAALADAAHARTAGVFALWGADGAGKSHLLRAFVCAANVAGTPAVYVASPAGVDAARDAACVAVDAIDSADAAAQSRLFTLFNDVRARGGQWVSASRVPPARTTLRDDLRTRLGWGPTFEIHVLSDADKLQALLVHAHERGLRLDDGVIAYLLAHGRRDMRSLTAALAALDQHSLSTKRAITIPLLREWMASSQLPL